MNNTQNITGNFNRLTGAFYRKGPQANGAFSNVDDLPYSDRYTIGFDPSLVVLTGPEVKPRSFNEVYWRKI